MQGYGSRVAYLGVVLTSVSTARLLAGSRRHDSLDSTLEKVTELESLDKVATEYGEPERKNIQRGPYEFQIMLRSLMPTCAKLS